MLREIVFDTETTGLYPEQGEKIVEIGAVELINHMPTGKTYHQYINPQKEIAEEVVKIHGLTYSFLKDYPVFADIIKDFLDFIGDSVLVAHNAGFDIGFLNYELKQNNYETLSMDRVIDTLVIAKKTFPGAKNNLDALCRRFNVDNTERTNHGALLDSELLAQVYLELLGGKEPAFFLNNKTIKQEKVDVENNNQQQYEKRIFPLSEAEEKEHMGFLENKIKNPLWLA